jgi:predicted NBD/HSP70 family sugar kinase
LRRSDLEPSPDRRKTANASAILLAVLDHGPIARSTIARIAGLSPAAVTRLSADLIRRGLVREVRSPASVKPAGRPHVPVDVACDAGPVVCGVHIALNHATLALVDLRGRVIARERLPHGSCSESGRVLTAIADRLPGFIAGQRRVTRIGVAVGGWVDSAAGVIVEHSLLGWRDVPVRDLLARTTGLPVHVDGHSRALARAEQLFGDHRARSSVVHLFVGNVVDAAFAVDGITQLGQRSAAGTVAHLPLPGYAEPCECGGTGCLQAEVSETTLVKRAIAAGIISKPSFPGLLNAARLGDPRAGLLFRRRARAVGVGAAVLTDLLDPEVLVVVEAGAMLLPGCLETLRSEVRRRSPATPESSVVTTTFGLDVLPVAAGSVALTEIYADPLTRA